MNRAVARRSLFETRDDIRFFLAGVVRSIRRGELEVHSWCVLTTHFHMLVRSPKGQLSDAMRRIQNAYARHFNRKRRRDGPLHRGRFTSKPVESMTYRRVLVRYIDDNAVRAGQCADPCDYRWGSAQQYATSRGPAWLQREWVESWVMEQAGTQLYRAIDYPRQLDQPAREFITDIVKTRVQAQGAHDQLDSLLAMASPEVLAWLQRKATLADGERASVPHVPGNTVAAELRLIAEEQGAWTIHHRRVPADGWTILLAGLLRELAAATFLVVAQFVGATSQHARRLYARHRQLVIENEPYGRIASTATQQILDRSYACIQRVRTVR